MMEFYVVNESLEIIGIMDQYKSAIWTERYYTSGDFEIYVPASKEMLEMMQERRFLVRLDDMEKAMVIETVKLTTSASDGDYLTVTGRSLKSILSRRIVWKQTTYDGQIEKVARRMVTDAFIDPEIAARTVSSMELGEELGKQENVKVQFSGEVMETALESLLRPQKLGYNLLMDLANKKIKFVLIEGKDRSFNQSTNPFVVFSDDFENLLSSDYTNDARAFKNVALIAGEGEGTARVKTVVGSGSGLGRFETFVDAKSQSTNSGELTEETYESLLQQKGTESLASCAVTESVDSEVAPNHTYVLNRDYFLGDVVEVINEYGIAMTPRVTEVIECQNDQGYTCIPTFAADE